MRDHRPWAAALTLLAVLVTGACSTPQAPPLRPAASDAHPDPAPTEKPPSAELQPYYHQRLEWDECGDGYQCAKLQVPLDYDKPDGERIQLSVNRLRAGNMAQRIGAILLNPGGPGGSGIAYARAATSVLSTKIRDRFDVVGFDPRGVGDSSPVRCLSTERLDAYLATDNTPDSADETKELEKSAREFADGCQAGAGRLLPHVGTVNAARDIDVLRSALGEPKLTYLGKSYGTYLGAVYADLFPKRVRALVLDGAVDPALDPVDLNLSQAKGFEVAMRAFVQDCFQQRPDCPFKARTVNGALDELAELLRRTDREPLRNSANDGRQITEAWASLGVITPLYDRRSWPALRQALSTAFKGEGTALLRMADILVDRRQDGTYSNQAEANMAINCVDGKFPQSTDAFTEAAERAAKDAPRFGESVMWGSLPCAFWPARATPAPDPLEAKGAPPILVVGTERDPATPYRWAKALAATLSSGVLLGFDGDGHTAYMTGSPCIDGHVDTYLLTAKPPPPNTRCPAII
ncbi:alpha/beta hydrolase [Spongiactinospora sp. TRM90649]|uniref:alpha/beta hydrolase n=1 Tax=Spongiactinospora sp. TRM90649 TaxID=3031114 RepID=UPI0023F80843|nr:alpha/beta hydrolase [Spongiactinospora sp. TRM90649]MDF5759083.1 alpha/beta hydrolase [Spongiactinospora sp. TRM90649]